MKKTLIFVSVLTVIIFLVSSCTPTPEARFNKVPINSIGGGGSGGSIECYSNSDCPMGATPGPYCEGNDLCSTTVRPVCTNPGQYDSYCDIIESVNCQECANGCMDGECEEVTYQGILDMLENCDNYLAHFGETCTETCNDVGKTCILADIAYGSYGHTSIDTCGSVFNNESHTSMECICCSPQ